MSPEPLEADTVPPQFDQELAAGIKTPPRGPLAILRQIGPGLIIAGSVVGSGELIATTKTGAQGGIWLLWLIVLGCLIKVFVQIELGRHAIVHGQTTLNSLNEVPGRIGPVNWIIWFWLAMMLSGLAQLGGIVGVVGQAMAVAVPITGDYVDAVALPSQADLNWLILNEENLAALDASDKDLSTLQRRDLTRRDRLNRQIEGLGDRGTVALEDVRSGNTAKKPWTWDDRIWASLVTLITMIVLYRGRYSLLQNLSTALVILFTFITIGNVWSLQATERWSVSADEFWKGLSFHLPPGKNGWDSMKTALATFGIIGVGATELITYPYWCIEKGYARFTGTRTGDEAWKTRSRGWMRVMHYDAFVSMLIYTFATVAFFIMGATVLHRNGLDPDDLRVVSTLSEAYVPVFGPYAKWLFLLGAIAVLYSTFLVANAGHARLYTDGMKIFGLLDRNSQASHDRAVSVFCVVLPLICCVTFWCGINPAAAILVAGLMQAIMLPMIAFGALYHRRRDEKTGIAPSNLAWAAALGISFLGLLLAGASGALLTILKALQGPG